MCSLECFTHFFIFTFFHGPCKRFINICVVVSGGGTCLLLNGGWGRGLLLLIHCYFEENFFIVLVIFLLYHWGSFKILLSMFIWNVLCTFVNSFGNIFNSTKFYSYFLNIRSCAVQTCKLY